MEKQHGDPRRPQQDLTHPAEGSQSGPRPDDSVLEGEVVEGRALSGPRQAVPNPDPMDSAMGGTSTTQGVASNTMGGAEVQSAGLSRRVLIDVLKGKCGDDEISQCILLLRPYLKLNLQEDDYKDLTGDIKKLHSHYQQPLKACNKMHDRVAKKYPQWLDEFFPIRKSAVRPEQSLDLKSPEEAKSVGRPELEWGESSEETRRKRARELAEVLVEEPLPTVVKAAQLSALRKGEKDLSAVLTHILSSPSKVGRLASAIKSREESTSSYTADEALAVIIDNDLSVSTYKNLREGAKKRGHALYPSYHIIMESKKKTKPLVLPVVTDVSAIIPLQALLDHTASRIINLQSDLLPKYFECRNLTDVKCTMIVSWGFDGSTGQSQYKQRFDSEDVSDDHCLFATTIIPLRLVTLENHVLWNNPTPQSVRYCRPLRLEYKRETKEEILNSKSSVDQEIATLTPYNITLEENMRVEINYQLEFTIIDGKVLSIVTGTKSQMSCPICEAPPSSFNTLNLDRFQPKPDCLRYGLSPLHAWIRCLEFVLHVGYRNVDGLKCWQVRGENKKNIFERRKQRIQTQLFEELGLRVDFPKAGGAGSSNDGNTARRAFQKENRVTFSNIIGVSLWLLEELHTLLVVISCGLPIDANKFGDFCLVLAEKYVDEDGWFHMPSSVHKLLIHGKDIIAASALPIGMLSEQAGESRNKLYRQFREFHARKSSRIANLTDIFNRSLESSDPIISDFSLYDRQKKLKALALPKEIINLLKPAEVLEFKEPTVARTLEFGDDENQDDDTWMQDANEIILDAEDDSNEM